jgi:hypothetical protein
MAVDMFTPRKTAKVDAPPAPSPALTAEAVAMGETPNPPAQPAAPEPAAPPPPPAADALTMGETPNPPPQAPAPKES